MLKTNLHKYSLADYTHYFGSSPTSPRINGIVKKKDRKVFQTIFNVYYNVIVWRPRKKNCFGKDSLPLILAL